MSSRAVLPGSWRITTWSAEPRKPSTWSTRRTIACSQSLKSCETSKLSGQRCLVYGRDLGSCGNRYGPLFRYDLPFRTGKHAELQPRKIRQELDAILSSTREMPSRMRQYAAFEFVQETIRSLLKANVLVSELKSEALRERHWSRLYKALRLPAGQQASVYVWDTSRVWYKH